MPAQYANDLADRARKTNDPAKAKELSNMAFDELLTNCQPTQAEFAQFASGLVISSETLWRLILMVPFWNMNSQY